MEPINYGIGAGTPVTTEDFLGGVNLGNAIGLGQQQAASAELARKQSIAAQQAHADMMARFSAEANREGGPTTDGIARLMVQFPSAAENLKKSLDAMAPAEKRERESQLLSTVSAINMKKPDIAIKGLVDKAAAYRQAGREKDAVALESVADLIKTDPTNAQFTLNSQLAAWLGPDYEKAMTALQGQESTLREGSAKAKAAEAESEIKATQAKGAEDAQLAALKYTKAQTNRLYAQTKNDADRLKLDRDRLVAENLARQAELQSKAGDLPEAVRKDADAAVNNGTKAKLQAESAEALSKKFREYDKGFTSSGLRASAGELLARWTGFETDVSTMRKQYDALVADRVVTNLPPGAASDKDIELIKGGFPDSTARPSQVADFLDAMAKVQRATEAQKRTESDYLYMNKSLSPARADIVVNGVMVPAGTSFADASALVQAKRKADADFATIPQRKAAAVTF